jgi:hypothetical protein
MDDIACAFNRVRSSIPSHSLIAIARSGATSIDLLPTLCETVENRFFVWGVKAFIGTRLDQLPTQSSTHPGQVFHYTRYDEVYHAARSLATWINRCHLPEHQQQHHVALW